MAEEFLHSADIVATLQQMRSETMTEGVAGDRLVDSCQLDFSNSFLQAAFMDMIAAYRPGAGVLGEFGGGKNVLSDPFPVGMGMLAFQGEGQVNML
jgi:hypothetical protein